MRIKKVFALLILLSAFSLPALAKTDLPEILGDWRYYKLIYQGKEMEPVDPKLVMTFTFEEVGLNSLEYHRDGESGFCQRSASWYFDPSTRLLYQRVVQVNPENRPDCQSDPDMQLNHQSWSPVNVKDGEFFLSVPLSEDVLTLVWKSLKK